MSLKWLYVTDHVPCIDGAFFTQLFKYLMRMYQNNVVHNVMPCLETYSSSENNVQIRSLPHEIRMHINAFYIQYESLHGCKDDITESFGMPKFVPVARVSKMKDIRPCLY